MTLSLNIENTNLINFNTLSNTLGLYLHFVYCTWRKKNKRLLKTFVSLEKQPRIHIKTTQSIMKRGYDPKILEKAYKVGNIVYVLDTATGHVVN